MPRQCENREHVRQRSERREERKDGKRGARPKKDGSQNSGGVGVEQKKKQTSRAWPLEVFAAERTSTSEESNSSSTGPNSPSKRPFVVNMPLNHLGFGAMFFGQYQWEING